MILAVSLLAFVGLVDVGDPEVPIAAGFVGASGFFPVVIAAGYDHDPLVLLNGMFDAARDPVLFLRTCSEWSLGVLSRVLEAFEHFVRSHLG